MLLDIHGSAVNNRETFTKTNFQDMGVSPEPGISAERDPDVHREGARKLVTSFSSRAARSYEPVVHDHVDCFIRKMEHYRDSGEVLNASKWFDYLAWDLAGDLTYGRDFGHVQKGKISPRTRISFTGNADLRASFRGNIYLPFNLLEGWALGDREPNHSEIPPSAAFDVGHDSSKYRFDNAGPATAQPSRG